MEKGLIFIVLFHINFTQFFSFFFFFKQVERIKKVSERIKKVWQRDRNITGLLDPSGMTISSSNHQQNYAIY